MEKVNKIAIASDHGGYELKNHIIDFLKQSLYIYKDFGCYDLKSVDYPDYAQKVSKAIISNDYQSGILVCGTGIGMSIACLLYTSLSDFVLPVQVGKVSIRPILQ